MHIIVIDYLPYLLFKDQRNSITSGRVHRLEQITRTSAPLGDYADGSGKAHPSGENWRDFILRRILSVKNKNREQYTERRSMNSVYYAA